MTNTEFATSALEIVDNYKTLYVMGCFGAPLTAKNKNRYSKNNSYNRNPKRQAMIMQASEDTFGFDCVGLVKSLSAWGWYGDFNKTYGGAIYESNGVDDMTIETIMKKSQTSTDFNNIEVGEVVCLKKYNHIGIYVGDGLVVESTPSWDNGVQITRLGNMKPTIHNDFYPTRTWDMHGKLPWIDYPEQNTKLYKLNITRDLKPELAEALVDILNKNGFASPLDFTVTKVR